MKRVLLITVAILCAANAQLIAGKLPPEFTYIVYISGQDAGRCRENVSKDTHVFR